MRRPHRLKYSIDARTVEKTLSPTMATFKTQSGGITHPPLVRKSLRRLQAGRI